MLTGPKVKHSKHKAASIKKLLRIEPMLAVSLYKDVVNNIIFYNSGKVWVDINKVNFGKLSDRQCLLLKDSCYYDEFSESIRSILKERLIHGTTLIHVVFPNRGLFGGGNGSSRNDD